MIVEEKTGRHVDVVLVMTGDEGHRYRGGQAMTDGQATEGYSSQGGWGQQLRRG